MFEIESKRSRTIPGATYEGVTRGGGSETIEWVRNGPMLLNRSVTYIEPSTFLWGGNKGKMAFTATSVPLLSGSADSDSTVRANGTTAAARSNPVSPSVNLLTSAGELASDGLPNPADFLRWKATVRDILRTAGGQYLSIQFAWLPLLGEIQAYCKQVRDYDRILREAKARDSKKVIKVGYSFPADDNHVRTTTTTTLLLWKTGAISGNPARARQTQSFEKKTWFEAEYVHLLPVQSDQMASSASFADKAKYILGLHLTPETLWELAPWSWAVDWFTNIGDVLSSVSNALSDGLVMRDAFVMHHTRRTGELVDVTEHRYLDLNGIPVATPARVTTISETKKRFNSVPYFGFGSVGELTPRQLSILAALGISRA